jgi:hypothetical protein
MNTKKRATGGNRRLFENDRIERKCSNSRITPRAVDAQPARHFLRDSARRLERAADAGGGRALIAGLDFLRRAPGLAAQLEAR